MFKELEIMEKTLRYLLIAVTVLSVLSLSAQTHQPPWTTDIRII